jgi:hypothetical protein
MRGSLPKKRKGDSWIELHIKVEIEWNDSLAHLLAVLIKNIITSSGVGAAFMMKLVGLQLECSLIHFERWQPADAF